MYLVHRLNGVVKDQPRQLCRDREMKGKKQRKRSRIQILARRIVDNRSSTIAAQGSGGKEIDDLLNGFVGAVICGLQFTVWLVTGDRAVVEAAVGERTAEPFVEEEKEQRDLDAFRGEAVGVSGPIPLQQAVTFEFA